MGHIYAALVAQNAQLQQEITELRRELELVKHRTRLALATIVYACPGHAITVSQEDMQQNYQLKEELMHHNKTVIFRARRL